MSYHCCCFPAVAEGALQPVISLCGMNEHIALLAVMTLSLIVEHQANLSALAEVSIMFLKPEYLSAIE